MKKGMRLTAVLMMLASFLFAGCGSSGGGDDPTPPPVPTTVAVESVSLDKTALTLKTGEDGTLAATVLPENATDKSVTWNSYDETVATVDQNGKVHAEAPGTATITVKTNDGGKTAVCAVTVADEVYTVSFNMKEHGTQLDNQTVAKNGKIVKPTDPTEAGVNFNGWYKEASYTNKWDFDTDTVTADMTLYAKWVNAYTVSFDANGGEGTMDDISVEEGGDCTVLASAFTGPTFNPKTGAVPATHENFAGWNTKADGSGDKYMPDDEILSVTADMTLYAQWAKPYFSVSTTKKVYFAKGNLQAVFASAGNTKTWQFAENQYDYVGNKAANTKINGNGSVSAKGTVDLFGWSTASTNYGINISLTNSFYSGNFKDWGKTIGDGTTWSTLSKDEWNYLISTSSRMINGKPCCSNAISGVSIGGKIYKGIFLYPDNYNGDVVSSSMTWGQINAAGIVFLPAAGRREAGSVNYVGSCSLYWSTTADSDVRAFYTYFVSSEVKMSSSNRFSGLSVRLVCVAD